MWVHGEGCVVCVCVYVCVCVCGCVCVRAKGACVCVCEQLPTTLHVKPLCCTDIVDVVTFPNMALTLNLLLFSTRPLQQE